MIIEIFFSSQQQIACQNSRIILKCPAGLVLHIYAAYFGIQSSTKISSFCSNSSSSIASNTPSMCFYLESFDSINATCEYRNSCYLRATPTQIGSGDLCPNFAKQLFVQYQCMDSGFLANTVNQCIVNSSLTFDVCSVGSSNGLNEKSWCDTETMALSCSSGTTVSIQCAFYGVHPIFYGSCDLKYLSNGPVCYLSGSSVTSSVSSVCNGKRSCNQTSLTLSDPCNGLNKVLFVQWQCV